MSASKQRNKVVVFRLTQDEYEDLREACSEQGRRTLSEFARSELLNAARSDSVRTMIQKRFAELERKLVELQMSVDQLADDRNHPMPRPSMPQVAVGQD